MCPTWISIISWYITNEINISVSKNYVKEDVFVHSLSFPFHIRKHPLFHNHVYYFFQTYGRLSVLSLACSFSVWQTSHRSDHNYLYYQYLPYPIIDIEFQTIPGMANVLLKFNTLSRLYLYMGILIYTIILIYLF